MAWFRAREALAEGSFDTGVFLCLCFLLVMLQGTKLPHLGFGQRPVVGDLSIKGVCQVSLPGAVCELDFPRWWGGIRICRLTLFGCLNVVVCGIAFLFTR